MKILKKPLWIALTAVFAVLLVVVIVGGIIANSLQRTINSYFQLPNYRTETVSSDEWHDSEYYKSDYVQKNADGSVMYADENGYIHQVYDDQALWNADLEAAYQVQREGTVVLWNDGGLPIAKDSQVSLFSHSSVDWVTSGWGSGAADTSGSPTMYLALQDAGLFVNYTLWRFYESGAGSGYKRVESSGVNEVPWSVLRGDSATWNSLEQYGDAAIMVISRRTGEEPYTDSFMSGADTLNGDYLELSQEEKDTIEGIIQLKNEGKIDKFVVLLNTAVGINFDVLSDYREDIDSCLWAGQTGTMGLNEVGKILVGDSVPTGHLVDTFLYNNRSNPASVNVEYQTYTNASSMGLSSEAFQGRYTTYLENIYVGYKYYETRYEDAVMNEGNARSSAGVYNSRSGWVYGEEVAFPFGYSASCYGDFVYSNFSAERDQDGNYEVSVTVTNNGSRADQDAVQVYIQKPYTQHDKDNGIEQAAVNLCGYAKTGLIEPGASETVTVTVRDDAFKTFDDAEYNTYIREKGTYYITAASDSHEATNNILAAKGYTPANSDNVMDATGNSAMVETVEFGSDDLETFSEAEKTGVEITTRFAEADWNKYSGKSSGTLTYLSRGDWQGTYPVRTPLSMTQQMVEETAFDKPFEEDPDAVMPEYDQEHVFNLVDLQGYDYDDDELWDQLLDQLSLEEQVSLQKAFWGTPGIPSISKPDEVIADGPLGVRRNYYTNMSRVNMSFPLSCLLAASYNDDLSYEVGKLMGEDMLHTRTNGIYAPTANLHRTAYGGRNYEYYSEDGFLTGMMAKYQVRGMQEKGCLVTMKHFALNDQESQRKGIHTWANEQSIRETYLVAFQYSVEEENLKVMMDSFNRIGTIWSGENSALLEDVLRGEWGFKGYVISDCPWEQYMDRIGALLNGQDCVLYEAFDTNIYLEKAQESATVAQALRQATRRILYTTVNSNAMNGYDVNTIMIPLTHWWQYVILGLQIGFGVLTAASAVMLVLCFVMKKKPSAQNA